MSIKLTGPVRLATPNLANWPGTGVTTWSMSMFFRYDGVPSAAGDYMMDTDYISFYWGFNGAWDSTNVRMGPFIQDTLGNPASPTAELSFSVGSTYHLAIVWGSNQQWCTVNGIRSNMGSLTGAMSTALQKIYLGGVAGGSSKVFSVRDFAYWTGYELAPTDIANLRDGTATPATISTPATAWLPLTGTQGNAVTVGDPGLANAIGGGPAISFNAIEGSGTAVYSDSMAFVPAAQAEAWVTTSGEAIYIRCKSIANGQWTPEVQYITEPTIKINGGSPIQLHADATTAPLRNVLYEGMLYPLPIGTAIGASDVVTISAPTGWVNTAAGIAASMTDQAVSNCVGRSYFGTDSLPKTMRVGANIDYLGFSYGALNPVMANYRQRGNSATALSGFIAAPHVRTTQMSGPIGSLAVVWMNDYNYMDGTGTPVPAGLCSVHWNDTGPDPVNHPTRLGIASGDGTVTEHTEYANAGTAGAGQVRVFDVRPIAPNTQCQVQIQIEYPNANPSGPAYTPSFDGDAIYLPGEFTLGSPTPYKAPAIEPSAILKRNLDKSGVHRWMNPTEGWDLPNACEPEHFQLASDWTYQGFRANWKVGFSQIRPWDPAVSPYVYTHMPGVGSTYTATLGTALDAPASGTQQTVTISDAMAAPTAASGPVLPSQVLLNGGEKLRIVSVTPTTGTSASVVVERGAVGTTPEARGTGSITVGYRIAMPSLTSWYQPQGIFLVEAVSSAPHNLRTFMVPATNGGWPNVTMTDGFVWNYGGSGNPAWVTSPTTLVWAIGGGFDNNGNNPNCTAAGTTSMDPATHYADINIPEGANAPFEVQYRVSAEFHGGGHNYWINIPLLASDSHVHAMAVSALQHIPAGARIYLEHQNEPWNRFTYTHGQIYQAMDWIIAHSQSDPALVWLTRRTGQIGKVFRDEFATAGRQGEIYPLVNMNLGTWNSVPAVLNQAKNEGLPIGGVTPSTYWSLPYDRTWQTYVNTRSTPFICSMAAFHLQKCATPYLDVNDGLPGFGTDGASMRVHGRNFRAQLDAWAASNAAWTAANVPGGRFALASYEGGPGYLCTPIRDSVHNVGGIDASTPSLVVGNAAQFDVGMYILVTLNGAAVPNPPQSYAQGPYSEWMKVTAIDTGTNTLTVLRGQGTTTAKTHGQGDNIRNAYVEINRDLVLHPDFYIANREEYAAMQDVGFEDYALFSLAREAQDGYVMWGVYPSLAHGPGRGDGSDGLADNRLCTATPGPHQKTLTTNQVANTVNVRGKAILDWNAAVGTAPATGTAPTVARSPARARRGRAAAARR